MKFHFVASVCRMNPVCPSYPTVVCETQGSFQWNSTCTCTTVTLEFHVSDLSYCLLWDTWDCPTESHVVLSVAWIPRVRSMWDTRDCPIESHVYHCYFNPTYMYLSMLSYCPIWLSNIIPRVPVWHESNVSILSIVQCRIHTVHIHTCKSAQWNPVRTSAA